ncbi:MAG: single-stranded-DNA-specific exonuclease RecJ [Ruminococcaceae bacterium]|jgi:single-stranded-DNA-specific exonuclease|nr:single-stranded-DNA-specific exonuclease RecJ [Oscillospiraceae bacterium]
MYRKNWSLSSLDKEKAALLAENLSLDPFIALMLVSRGITEPLEVDEFFSDEVVLSNPFEIRDMEKAVERIRPAIESKEKIAVFGDYDADGVTATALLYSYLKSCGADAVYYIPNRMTEGYGTSNEAIDELKKQGVTLIITVDNGIAAVEETEYAKTLGIDMVITDHHKAGEVLPDAVAVVDPHREDDPSAFKEWAGVGVAFKLVCAIEGVDGESLLNDYCDLIAIGTLADVVSLTDENRTLVKAGLEKINTNPRLGIEMIKQVAGNSKSLSSMGVAFTVAPRINAAGRMGSAYRALELLLCDDGDRARVLAEEIDKANRDRQSVEANITSQAISVIEEKGYKYDKVIVVSGEGWHSGVIGIVAARLVEKYGKPAIVIAVDEDSAKGSARSLGDFSMYDALCNCAGLLTHFGGHVLAAGLGIEKENIDAFRKAINDYASGMEMPFPTLKLDCKLNPSYISVELANNLSAMEPFGNGNEQPLFGLYGMTVTSVRPIGDGKHLRMTLSKGDSSVSVVKFGTPVEEFPYTAGDRVDVAVKIERNEYRGEIRTSVQLRGIRFSGVDEEKRIASIRLYENYYQGTALEKDLLLSLKPDREFLGNVFSFIKNNSSVPLESETLAVRMGVGMGSFAKLLIALDVLTELKTISKTEEGNYVIPEKIEKTDLSNSAILNELERRLKQ